MKKGKKYIFIVLAAVLVLAMAGLLGLYLRAFHYRNDTARKGDVAALENGAYQHVYLTMYAEEFADEYPFEYYMGWECYTTEHCFEKLTDVADYMDLALQTQGELIQIFTLFDPAKVNEEFFQSTALTQKAYQQTLLETVTARQDVEFVFLLPPYSLEYWLALSEEQVRESMDSYRLFCNTFSNLPNVRIYFFGHCDWLIDNPDNYEDVESCNTDVLNRLIALSIADAKYLVTPDVLETGLAELTVQIEKARQNAVEAIDLSQYRVVFFGDSIIGNYSGSMSVPGVITAKTGAETYNCAIGGQSACHVELEGVTPGFDVTLSYFLGENTTAFPEKEQFRQEVARFRASGQDDKKLVFVIGYGINDYFSGYPVGEADEQSLQVFTGALNSGITRLQQAYPEAEILLVTPTFVWDFGYGEKVNSDQGGPLAEYARAVLQVAKQKNLLCLNLHEEMGINRENYAMYLEDGTHLNEKGRFLYAEMLADFLKN